MSGAVPLGEGVAIADWLSREIVVCHGLGRECAKGD
jgi:hypothetical protein